MSYLLNNQQKLNEIVFANRNKSYGAYVIRSCYGETVLKSLGIMSGIVCVVFTSAYVLSDHVEDILIQAMTIPETVYSVPVNLEKEKPEQTTSKKSEPPAPRNNNEASATNNVISDSAEVSQTTNTVFASVNSLSLESTSITGDGLSTASNGNNNSITINPESSVKSNFQVDKLPEFEGGLKALYRFIAENTHFTDEARELGIGGKVVVQFIVDEEGNIGSIILLNKIGHGLDEEALRVAGIIPK